MDRIRRRKPGFECARYFFFAVTGCLAAAACCFFWLEALDFDCFWAAFLLTDFGDLSPIVSGLLFTRFRELPGKIPAHGNTRTLRSTCTENPARGAVIRLSRLNPKTAFLVEVATQGAKRPRPGFPF